MNVTKDLILTPYLILSNGTKIDVTKEFEPYGYRSMWNIVWTCALTIFTCTWATIHPNIHPNIPSRQWSRSKFCYKAQLWIIALIMPELLLLWAAKQYFAARDLAKRKARPGTENTGAEEGARDEEDEKRTQASSCSLLRDPSTVRNKGGNDTSDSMMTAFFVLLKRFFTARNEGGNDTSDWTMTQAFFALMGGFQDEAGCILSPSARGYAKPTDEEIRDKGKRDSFVKFLALAQTLWFVLVTIYRIQSPVLYATEAEIVTFTFACLSFITNFFWWNKPQGIDLPLRINPIPIHSQQNPEATTYDLSDTPPPNCFKLATSMLRSDSLRPRKTPTHDDSKFISKSDVYAYDGQLSRDKMTVAVLCASFLGSLSGVCHLVIASLNHGLAIASAHGRIWFSFAFVGSALPIYLLLVAFIFIVFYVLKVMRVTEQGEGFLHYALNTWVGQAFLIVSVIGRIALIVALIYFTFSPYPYIAFLTPKWSHYIPHPF